MSRVLTDDEIARLLAEPKPLPANWQSRLAPKPKADRSYTQRELDLRGDSGGEYRIVIRGSQLNRNDFSIILVYKDADGTTYRLTRFNGRHPSQHSNKWEKARKAANATFRNRYHIHYATERYQIEGYDIDGYAEVTEEYDSFESALDLFVRSNGLSVPPAPENPQGNLFGSSEGTP